MIIMDLDGTLADCTHRRHYVAKPWDTCGLCHDFHEATKGNVKDKNHRCLCGAYPGAFKPRWDKFYAACDKDTPIPQTIEILHALAPQNNIEIWSGRSEVVRDKTIAWINKHIGEGMWGDSKINNLRMRPKNNHMCDQLLKEQWLDEYIANGGKPIEMVFDDRPRVLRMWERRGIWTFNCNQGKGEF